MITLRINMVTSRRLLLTDPDRLMYEIKTEDIYEHFSND